MCVFFRLKCFSVCLFFFFNSPTFTPDLRCLGRGRGVVRVPRVRALALLEMFLSFNSNTVNINRYNPHKQQFFESSIIFKNMKGSWNQKERQLLNYKSRVEAVRPVGAKGVIQVRCSREVLYSREVRIGIVRSCWIWGIL